MRSGWVDCAEVCVNREGTYNKNADSPEILGPVYTKGCGHSRVAQISEPDFSSNQGGSYAVCPEVHKEEPTKSGGKSAGNMGGNTVSTPSNTSLRQRSIFLVFCVGSS